VPTGKEGKEGRRQLGEETELQITKRDKKTILKSTAREAQLSLKAEGGSLSFKQLTCTDKRRISVG
jgi:hypothetical protein